MQQAHVGHLVYNIKLENMDFYKKLFGFLGWSVLYEHPAMLGVGDDRQASVWFGAAREGNNDYDAAGLNHLGLSVASQADVDEAVAFLQEHGVAALFETPRHRPEFSAGPDQTYYQVMFESPDRLLFEIVYTGPMA